MFQIYFHGYYVIVNFLIDNTNKLCLKDMSKCRLNL